MSRWTCCCVLVAGLVCSAIASGVETVRVETVSGAPRLVVDGQSVRARMFFGLPGTKPLRADARGKELSFEFTPTESEPHTATMHFRFGHAPGTVDLDDIHVRDLTTGRDVLHCDFEAGAASFSSEWNVFPPDARNTVGKVEIAPRRGRDESAALHVTIQAPPDGNWPDFHIYHNANLALEAGHRYRVSLWVRTSRPAI